MAFLITKELIFWVPNFGFFYHFSALRLLFVQRCHPEIFFKLLETIFCDLLKPKFKDQKISLSKLWSIFKGFDREIIGFQT